MSALADLLEHTQIDKHFTSLISFDMEGSLLTWLLMKVSLLCCLPQQPRSRGRRMKSSRSMQIQQIPISKIK